MGQSSPIGPIMVSWLAIPIVIIATLKKADPPMWRFGRCRTKKSGWLRRDMLEHTKKQTSEEFADICFRVPAVHADRIRVVVGNILALIRGEGGVILPAEGEEKDRLYSIDEVFPNFHPGDTLKGARLMHEMTQAQLAALIGVKASHISEMEKGKRPIGKEMAKRLARALNTSYQVFL